MEDSLLLSWVAYRANRIDDSWAFVKMAAIHPECTFPDELQDTLMHVAKLLVTRARNSLAKVQGKDDVFEANVKLDAQRVCSDVLTFVEHLMHHVTNRRHLPFAWKMRGDFLRYSIEFGLPAENNDIEYAYLQAHLLSNEFLPAFHTLRLTAAFYLAKMYYDYYRAYDVSMAIAKRARDDALPWQHATCDKKKYVMQLLESMIHSCAYQLAQTPN